MYLFHQKYNGLRKFDTIPDHSNIKGERGNHFGNTHTYTHALIYTHIYELEYKTQGRKSECEIECRFNAVAES